MDLNKNDYVIVNGKKYYAEGGRKDPPPFKGTPDKNEDEFLDGKPYHINDDGTLTINRTLPKNQIKLLEDLSTVRYEIMNEMEKNPKQFKSKLTQLVPGNTSFSNIYWYKHPTKGKIALRKSGDNYFFDADSADYGLAPVFQYHNGIPLTSNGQSIPSNVDWQYILKNGVDKNSYVALPPEHYLIKKGIVDKNNPNITMQQYIDAANRAILKKAEPDNVSWFNYEHNKDEWENAGLDWNNISNANKLALVSNTNPQVRKLASKYISNIPENVRKKLNHAYGGPTTRLYAVGGTTGEQIPIGEQPEDYNMVNAGGSHEMNPQGGVPYGMNQDGSQNMVEQGEVSVGNNVFSDRTSISPELCQQLGLPEGTSPAQAMQQIQQLYEQGQIGDEEFQEIQQIIFDDQEAQKQNVGGSYQQGQVGGEGITPDMMQGQNMPPQAMPQQGAPEGIAPEMVQGGAYAFGGRRRC